MNRLFAIPVLLVAFLPVASQVRAAAPCDYAVVVSKRTHDDPEWKKVVDALVEKHAEKYHAQVIEYATDVNESLAPLRKLFPRYAAFVAQPDEAAREFVIKIHRLTRKLDDDPYTDVVWGIITGYRSDDALRIVHTRDPLEIRRGAAGTGLNLDLFDEGFASNEGSDDEYTIKPKGGRPEKKHGQADAAKPLVDLFEQYKPQLFVTSGHATWRDWQIGFPPHRRGQFRCQDGVLYGVDMQGKRYPLRSPEPKVYLPVGNCLMGLIHNRQSMALAWLGSGGADQMIGYVVSTWFGRAGWGTRDYLFSEPGRYTLTEAFYFNNQSITYELQTRFPKSANIDFNQWNIETDRDIMGRLAAQLGYAKQSSGMKDDLGLHWDHDTLAFYGDPTWEARLAPQAARFTQSLSVEGERYTFTLKADEDCSPDRPPAMLLPHRLRDIKIVVGQKYKPLVTGKFIMVMQPGKLEKGKSYKIVFTAKEVDRSAEAAKLNDANARIAKAQAEFSAAAEKLRVANSDKAKAEEELRKLKILIAGDPNRSTEDIERQFNEDMKAFAETRPVANADDALNLLPEKYRKAIAAQFKTTSDNQRGKWIKTIHACPTAQREGLAFLLANMPASDLESLTKDFLLNNLRDAYQARAEVPWGAELPDEIFLNDVLPYASINERRDDWRKDFYHRFMPLAKKCKSAGEAAILLNKAVFEQFDVHYNATKRPKPDQSPYESAAARFASCTGLSVMAIDAFRAVAIPARFAGVPTWTGGKGNHSWTEVWDGSWHFVGAAESPRLDEAWFAAKAAQADPSEPMNCIYATSFARTGTFFPLVWDLSNQSVPAIDVTASYKNRRSANFRIVDGQGKPTVAAVTLRYNGHIVAAGSGKSNYEFTLAGGLTYDAQLQSVGNEPKVQKIELPKKGSEAVELRL